MKPRPRNAENEIATRLSLFFTKHGMETVERVPIIGRTGPDFEINDFGWVIDLKSRDSCPKKYFKDTFVMVDGSYIMFPMSKLDVINKTDNDKKHGVLWLSPTVDTWYKHMYKWTKDSYKEHMQRRFTSFWHNGITSIILHRKGMSYDSSMVFMHISDWIEFQFRLQYYEESEAKDT